MFKSFTKSFRSSSSRTLPVSVDPTIVGTNLINKADILTTLKKGSTDEKINTINELKASIEKVSISSIPEIWYLVRDNIKPGVTRSLRRETYKLLVVCIKLSDFATPTRLNYYKDIVENCVMRVDSLDPDFDLILRCLTQLSDNGRDIYDFFLYDQQPFNVFTIDVLTLLKNIPGQESLTAEMIELLGNCLRLNFNLFESSDLLKILTEILEITSLTSDMKVLQSSLSIINSFVVFGNILSSSLYFIISLLGSARLLGDPQIATSTTTIVNNLLSNPSLSFLTATNLCDVIQCKNLSSNAERNNKPILGCIDFLIYYADYYQDKSNVGEIITNITDTSFVLILRSLIVAASYQEVEISVQILKLLLVMFQKKIVKPFYMLSTNESSVWKLLKMLKLDTSNESYKSNLIPVLNHLQNASIQSGLSIEIVELYENYLNYVTPSQIEMILDYYSNNLLCVCLTPEWSGNCDKLIMKYSKLSPLSVFRVIKESYTRSITLRNDPAMVTKYLVMLFDDCTKDYDELDKDQDMLNEIASSVVQLLPFVDDAIFEEMITNFHMKILVKSKFSMISAQTIAHLTLVLFQNPANRIKVKICFERLIEIARFSLKTKNYNMFLVPARLFIRIRCTSEKDGEYLYFIQVNDVDGLCDTLGRNLETISDESEKAKLLKGSKWFYPEADHLTYLPSDLLLNCNKRCLKRPGLNRWLEMVVDVLNNFYDWEIYSYILGHLCPQLADTNLFSQRSKDPITRLFRTLCLQLQLKFPPSFNLESAPSVSKADVQVAILRTFTSVTAYKSILTRNDEDNLINSVIIALQSWNRTGIPSVHFLNISCYEFPDSIKKFLSPILTILQTRISNPLTSAPILDFLLSLSEMPSLISNFTIEEFKRIFGIAFKYIQYSNDTFQNKKTFTLNYNDSNIDNIPSTRNFEITKQLLQYLTSLSYRVISGWFIKLSFAQKKALSSFIIKQLLSLSTDDPKNLSLIELVTRFTFCQIDLKSDFFIDYSKLTNDNNYVMKSWIYGSSILTIYTNRLNGESEVLVRRSTTVSHFKVTLDKDYFPDWIVDAQSPDNLETDLLNSSNSSDESPTIFTPSFLMIELLYQSKVNEKTIKPIPLMKDETIDRSIAMFDRIPVFNFHKIGVLYVAPNQENETEILGNQFGSKRYHKFVNELGQLVRLKDCKRYYVGGLDTYSDQDGEFMMNYQSVISQTCFHVTTMMPNSPNDPHFNNKKKHIGNNFVNIYWNESSIPVAINKVSSQFNFIIIVIEPRDEPSDFYKVKIYRKAGIPGIFSTSHFKLISEPNLATFIRRLCELCAQFSDVWNDPNWGFNWERRLQQINNIRARNDRLIKEMRLKQSNNENNRREEEERKKDQLKRLEINNDDGNVGQSFMDQLNGSIKPTGEVNVNADQFEFLDDEEDNESYRNLEINSFN